MYGSVTTSVSLYLHKRYYCLWFQTEYCVLFFGAKVTFSSLKDESNSVKYTFIRQAVFALQTRNAVNFLLIFLHLSLSLWKQISMKIWKKVLKNHFYCFSC